MNVRNQLCLLAGFALTLASCSEENPWGQDGTGGIKLHLTTNAEVENTIPVLRSSGTAPDVPDVADFAITLTKTSTSEVREFASIDEFNAASNFPSGGYVVSADYGSLDNGGFGNPCYHGEATVTVLDGRTAEASITATLASSMVSIQYTEAFKTYFKDYSASVHTEGHDFIDYPATAVDPVYIAPGEVGLTIHVTNQSGKTADLQPASFTAEAAKHYSITMNVNNGNVGQAQLEIIFDDTLDKEDVTIDLTDELFVSAAPSVNPLDFESGALFEANAGAAAPSPVKFNLSAPAGFKTVTMTITGDGYTPAFGNEIDLCSATAAQQQQLADAGVVVKGLYGTSDKYAYIDITNLPVHLPSGDFTVTFVAKDIYDRVCDPVSVRMVTVPIVLDVVSSSALLNSSKAVVEMNYNGDNADDITFKAMDKHGVWKDATVAQVLRKRHTRAVETKTYTYTLNIPDTDRAEIPLQVYLCGVKRLETTVSVTSPEYTVEADGFSTYGALLIKAADASQLDIITSTAKVYLNGEQVAESRLARNAETGVITVTGLTPSANYTAKTSLYADGSLSGNEVTFSAEAATALPNGDFSETTQTINMSGVNSGGKYKAGVKSACYNTETISIYEPTGWASLNPLTCWTGASTINSWFTVPSTYVSNGQTVIRSVAYDHAGTEPEYKDWGLFKYNYYNPNLPASIASRSSGELIFGTYSYDGSEHRAAKAFTCRPKSLTFDYSYVPYGSDVGCVTVKITAADGTVIANVSQDLASSSSMKTLTVNMPDYAFGRKAANMEIVFRSTKGTAVGVNMPASGNIDNVSGVPGVDGGHKLGENGSKSLATGSVLTIDNVKLNY